MMPRCAGLLVLACLFGCTTGHYSHRVYVEQTDNLVRKPIYDYAIDELLEPPSVPSRVIATLVALDSATDAASDAGYSCKNPDCDIWRDMRRTAASLGGTAVLFKSREIVQCAAPAQSVAVAGTMSAEAVSVGARELKCVEIRADVLLLNGTVDCASTQQCRTDRNDAYELKPARGLLKQK